MESARERELAAREMLHCPDTIGVALSERRWDLVLAVAEFVEGNPLPKQLAFTDASLYRRMAADITHYHLAGWGRLDVTKLAELASRTRAVPASETVGSIARTVRRLRCEQGLTQEALAAESGVALATLRVFESTGQVGLHHLVTILDALNARNLLDGLLRG